MSPHAMHWRGSTRVFHQKGNALITTLLGGKQQFEYEVDVISGGHGVEKTRRKDDIEVDGLEVQSLERKPSGPVVVSSPASEELTRSYQPARYQFARRPQSALEFHDRPEGPCGYSHKIDAIRKTEFKTLEGQAFLDHAGSTPYPQSLVDAIHDELSSNLLGNPHSGAVPSQRSGGRVNEIRYEALKFLGCDPEHFEIVFTANATAAVKLVMEGFRDTAAATNTPFWYGYHYESHTSLVGVRESTGRNHQRCFESDEEVEEFARASKKGKTPSNIGLFAFPGQSNLTGRRLPWEWNSAMRECSDGTRIYTLMDTAALASTSQLWGMKNVHDAPDFAVISFYKIFGLPDLGCLIVKKSATDVLTKNRVYFGGGTVDFVSCMGGDARVYKKPGVHEALEEGTIPFHNIVMLGAALRVHRSIFCDMFAVSAHTQYLTHYLHEQLLGLKNPITGGSMIVLYNKPGMESSYGNSRFQGAVVSFNLLRRDGSMVPHADVTDMLSANGIYLRSGSICNPGGFATYLNWNPAELMAAVRAGHSCSEPQKHFQGKPTGMIRASLGACSTADDVDMLILFLREHYVQGPLGASIPVEDERSSTGEPPNSPGVVSDRDLTKELPPLPRGRSYSSLRRAAYATKDTMARFGQMGRRLTRNEAQTDESKRKPISFRGSGRVN